MLKEFYPGIDDQGTPSPADDTLANVTITFDVDNQGIYAIYDLTMNFYMYNHNLVFSLYNIMNIFNQQLLNLYK